VERTAKAAVHRQRVISEIFKMTFSPYDNEIHKVLCDLGKILMLYLNEHRDHYPEDWSSLEAICHGYDVDFSLAKQRLRYLGKDKACRSNPPDMVIAFDETMLDENQETYVLFNDAHVEHISSQKAKELGLQS
jgi:hypothetical protein